MADMRQAGYVPLLEKEIRHAAAPALAADLSSAALQRILAWLSPAFPVGGYTYSHGLEWAIEDGTVKGTADLEAWIGDVVRHGAGRSDAVLFAHGWRAAKAGNLRVLGDLIDLGAALQPSKERHLEATAQGRAFVLAVSAAWPNERLTVLTARLSNQVSITYPVAVATAAACEDIPLDAALTAWLSAFAASLVSAGVRAIPIGQTDGQRILARLVPLIEAIAKDAIESPLEDIGGVALRADIASMKHETQYTRLFRS